MTKLFNGKRAASLMEARGIDILVGSGYVNFGYLAGYFTHFGRDYPGPLVNGAPLVRFAGVPKDPNLSPFLITYPGEEGDIVAQGSWIDERTRRHDLGHFSAEIPLLVTGSGCELLSELPYGLAVV